MAPKRIIKVGSDFSGMDTAVVALKRLKHLHTSLEFCSDNDEKCKQFVQEVHAPKRFFDNAMRSKEEQPPAVDVYINTPPCQSFSMGGNRQGIHDQRGRLLKVGLKYAAARHPKVWVLENVPTIAKFKKYAPMRKRLVSALESIGYKVFVKVLDARSFRLAQMRRRMFIVALKADSIVVDFKWPKAASAKAKIRRHLDRFNPKVDKPGRLPRSPTAGRW